MENNNITFNDAVMTCLHKYADFSGRACRSEYWYFVVFNMVVQAGLQINSQAKNDELWNLYTD